MKWQLVLVAALAASAIRIDVLGATINVPTPPLIDTIQDAVDVASNGDEIVVAPGTWGGFDTEFSGLTNLTIRSQDPEDPEVVLATVVDSGSFLTGFFGVGGLLRIEGMSFRNAGAFGLESSITLENCSFSAGARFEGEQVNLTAKNCVFTNARETSGPLPSGGAIALISGEFADLIDCAFYNNTTVFGGGAVGYSGGIQLTMRGCDFVGNFAAAGGAVEASGNLVDIRYCTFNGNGATSSGGAITANADEVLLEGCVITGNRSGSDGGGASLNAGIGELRKCVVQANTAAGAGGGIAIAGFSNPFTATGGVTTVCANLPGQISGALSGMLRMGENCPPPGFVECLGDLDDDGMVGFTDLTILLANWGPCC